MVLQHGFLGGSGYFEPQMAALGEAYDIVAPDLPGFAGSAEEPPPATIKDLSQAQMALLNDLGIEKFSLLGHSMGGMVALQTALDYPKRVEKLILYATSSSGYLPNRFETFEETKQKVEREGLAKVAASVTATWFRELAAAPMYSFCLDAGKGASKAAVLACLEAFPFWDVTQRMAELRMPTLVISGDADRSYSVDGIVRLAGQIQSAELCLLPGCAHCAHLEASDLFNSVVTNFLNKTH